MKKKSLKDFFGNMKWYEILAACWPGALIFVGGAIGGGCGGLACYFNVKLFKSGKPQPLKYVFSFLIGIGSILIYFLIVLIFATIFPNAFK